MSALGAHTGVELRLALRQGERLLATFGIPALLLVFLTKVDVLPAAGASRVDFLVPGILTLAILSTGMVSLGIATGFERSYLVLKRLGATPLRRGELVAAKVAAVVAVEALQVAVLLGLATALGWRPERVPVAAIGLVAVGTVLFSGLGLLMAGTLPAEGTLALANGLYVVLLFLGGIAFPLDRLPWGAEAVARLLPAAALTECLRAALGPAAAFPWGAFGIVIAWTLAAPSAAALLFRWE